VDSDPPAKSWSECSRKNLKSAFEQGLDYCLHNKPKHLHVDAPGCGNGIVDQGEDCDCANADESVR